MYDHTIDPSGDAVISLQPSKAPFALWKSRPTIDDFGWSTARDSRRKKKDKGKHPDRFAPPSPEPEPEVEASVRFLVSSRHLILASPVIAAMLSTSSGWSEAQKDADGLYQVEAEDWDENAFSIVLNVLHGQYRKVPETVALEMLAKIAIIVDYYQVHEAVVMASRMWLTALKVAKLPTELDRDLCLRLTVASVFADAELFKSLTRVAILQSWEGMTFPADLPIPLGVNERIEEARNSSFDVIVQGLETLRGDYLQGRKGCDFECRAIHLGALSISMQQLKIDDYIAMGVTTIVELVNGLKGIQSPQWSDSSSCYHDHSCPNQGPQVGPTAFDLNDVTDSIGGYYNSGGQGTLNKFAAQLVQSVKGSLVGLELSDFVTVHPENDMLFKGGC